MPKHDDIRPLGASQGIGYYWIKEEGMYAPNLRLVAITDLGEVRRTPLTGEWAETALTEHEALVKHLSAGIAQADADLDHRRAELPERPTEPRPAPVDRATQRFFGS